MAENISTEYFVAGSIPYLAASYMSETTDRKPDVMV
jgi:hypothetical protein